MTERATIESTVLVVIVNYRSAQLTFDCVRSLEPERRDVPNLRVVVVENNSGEADVLRQGLEGSEYRDWVRIVESDYNGGFAYGFNLGLRAADDDGCVSQLLLLLNPDTRVYPGAVRVLCDFLQANPQVGIVGSGLDLADGTNWPFAFRFPSIWSEIERGISLGLASKILRRHAVAQQMGNRPAQIDWVPGASMMVRRDVMERVGCLDECFFLYFEETDFCRRAKNAGSSCWYVPESRVLHIAGQSTGLTAHDRKPERVPRYWFESRRRYFLKHHGSAYAAIADLAFVSSRLLGRLKGLLRRADRTDPPKLLRDFLRHSSIWRRNRRLQPEITYHPASSAEAR